MALTKRFKYAWAALAVAGICLLGGCAAFPGAATQNTAAVDATHDALLPEISPLASAAPWEERTVSLYFRMRDEAMLAREERSIPLYSDMRLEKVLIESLIEGPSPSSLDLTSPFIPGTRVISITESGSLLLVTLSQAFLDTPLDAPTQWQSDPVWRREVLLRRRLALASIVNTITEATSFTAVQLLVQENPSDMHGERISRQHLYEVFDGDPLLTPVSRDESVILTHHNTAAVILDCWLQKDFARLYRLVASPPTEAAFTEEVLSYSRTLTNYSLSPGTVSADGQRAVLVVNLTFLDGGAANVVGYTISLMQENGLWKIEYPALLRLMEAT